jgi:hypothetical protein
MTIKDEEGSDYANNFEYHQMPHTRTSISTNVLSSYSFDLFLARYQRICDIHGHSHLKADLIDHLWNKMGSEPEE